MLSSSCTLFPLTSMCTTWWTIRALAQTDQHTIKGRLRSHVHAMQPPRRRFHAVANLFGSASGFSERTNHNTALPRPKVTISGRRTSGPRGGRKDVRGP